MEYRCVDCGECIRTCPYRAKSAVTDPLESIQGFDWRVALPAPALYSQFDEKHSIESILGSIISLGFNEVYEVARSAEEIAQAAKIAIDSHAVPFPAISSSCPAVLRLIQIRFPSLLPNVLPLVSPMELAARTVRKAISRSPELANANVGVFFISPCAAKVTDARQPIGSTSSAVDGVISFKDVYLKMRLSLGNNPQPVPSFARAPGIAWGRGDGEAANVGEARHVSVDGMDNVIRLLEAVENGQFKNLVFIEAMACPAGCIGGPLTVENPYIAKTRLKNREQGLAQKPDSQSPQNTREPCLWTDKVYPRNDMILSNDMNEAMRLESEMETLAATMPGLDCGSCGAPTCKALAEDIIRGTARKNDCVFKLRETVRILATEMLELELINPPALDRDQDS
jgi:hypothetical protein